MRAGLPVKESTAALRQDHVRWGASALVMTGVPIEEITSIACLVPPLSRAQAILRYIFHKAGDKPSARGLHVAEVLQIIVKYYAGLPADAIPRYVSQIRNWAKQVRLKYTGMTDKNEACIQDMMTPERELELIALPKVYMNVAQQLLPEDVQRACSKAMAAALIQLLRTRSLRLGEIQCLRLDRHLRRAGAGKKRITHLNISADETKNNLARFLSVPEETAEILEIWITTFRPLVAAPGCAYLFPGHGKGNKPITHQGFRDAVKKATYEHVGVTLTPHQFRHLKARIYLDERPRDYPAVQRYLGHADLNSVMRSYSGSETDSALRQIDETMFDREMRFGRNLPNRRSPSPPSRPRRRR
jgi:site-specific recombinase XerD